MRSVEEVCGADAARGAGEAAGAPGAARAAAHEADESQADEPENRDPETCDLENRPARAQAADRHRVVAAQVVYRLFGCRVGASLPARHCYAVEYRLRRSRP